MKRIYFIDSENVGDCWIALLEAAAPEDEILVFYTERSPHMNYRNIIILKQSDRDVDFIECFEGNNALDFQLCTELGYRIHDPEVMEYVIVSNDNGYNAVVKYWQKRNLNVIRITGRNCYTESSRISEKKGQHTRRHLIHQTAEEKTETRIMSAQTTVVEDTVPVTETVAQEITPITEPVPEEITPAAEPVPEETAPIAETVTEEISPIAETVAEEIAPIAETVAEEIAPITEPVPEEIAPAAEPVPEEIAPITEPVPEETAPAAEPVPEEIAPVAEPVPEETAPVTETVAEEIAPVAEPVPEETTPSVEPVPEETASAVEPVPEETAPAPDVARTRNDGNDRKHSDRRRRKPSDKAPVQEDIEDSAKEILYILGKENLQLLHEALQQLYDATKSKVYYNAFKSNGYYNNFIARHKRLNLNEKYQLYYRIVFELSETDEEMPEDLPSFATETWKKKKNLNSFRSSLQNKYGKQKAYTYYSLIKNHVKIVDQIK